METNELEQSNGRVALKAQATGSQAIGAQATQVKLSFEGDEDDIIQTIRAGDINVTLFYSSVLPLGLRSYPVVKVLFLP